MPISQTKGPKVSVAIVTYNHERFIAKTLDSIIVQKRDFDIEVVIGEDSSTDGTRAIIERYVKGHPNEIRLLPTSGNVGASRNSAQVLEACRGEYIAPLDGDDHWADPTKLADQVRLMDECPELSMCHTLAEYFSDTLAGEQFMGIEPANEKYRRTVNAFDILEESFITTSSVMFRRAYRPRIDEDMMAIRAVDRVLFLLLALKGDVGFINRMTTRYRLHDANAFRLWSLDEKAVTAARTYFYVARHAAGPLRGKLIRKGNKSLYSMMAWLGGKKAFTEGWKVASLNPSIFAPLMPMILISAKVLAVWTVRLFLGTRQ